MNKSGDFAVLAPDQRLLKDNPPDQVKRTCKKTHETKQAGTHGNGNKRVCHLVATDSTRRQPVSVKTGYSGSRLLDNQVSFCEIHLKMVHGGRVAKSVPVLKDFRLYG
ncbi:hypothetical protein RUM43_012834 [Polyplax serrata]|uniref:Uncharacterized protein n=1 Tax=Polyplax serrata TaxID=468196 RepID=A0AAN8S7A9_POLSC